MRESQLISEPSQPLHVNARPHFHLSRVTKLGLIYSDIMTTLKQAAPHAPS